LNIGLQKINHFQKIKRAGYPQNEETYPQIQMLEIRCWMLDVGCWMLE